MQSVDRVAWPGHPTHLQATSHLAVEVLLTHCRLTMTARIVDARFKCATMGLDHEMRRRDVTRPVALDCLVGPRIDFCRERTDGWIAKRGIGEVRQSDAALHQRAGNGIGN